MTTRSIICTLSSYTPFSHLSTLTPSFGRVGAPALRPQVHSLRLSHTAHTQRNPSDDQKTEHVIASVVTLSCLNTV